MQKVQLGPCLVKQRRESGQILEIHTSDKGAKNDFSAWAKSVGHELLKHEEENDVLKFWIKKG